jgi:putative flippase GtrA
MSERGVIARVVTWSWHQRHRFLQFGMVGVTGITINQIVIWLCQERLYAGVSDESLRLNLAMATGIALGMTNNFHWNRKWTWKDRARTTSTPIIRQYLQYCAANWAGILIQVALTNLLVNWTPYLLANLVGIGFASLANFALNDLWTYRHVRTEGIDPEHNELERARLALPLLLCGLVLALCTYLVGLGSLHILSIGDEFVYMQIARVTAASGHWLPLQSGMEEMRNTKPPLIFWQALLSTDWGAHWGLVALRWPSVAWTFATALVVGVLTWRLSARDILRSVLASLFFLAFFSSFRYGRPFLTNPPETFWFFSCFALLAWRGAPAFYSRWGTPALLGLLAGIALLTKSFAQLLPIAVALLWWHGIASGWSLRHMLRAALPAITLMALLALGIFSLWFAFDPDPAAIWREFVLGENVGKLAGGVGDWMRGFLASGDSVWTLAASWFVNAGLLAFPLFGVMVESWKHRRELTMEERLLWALIVAVFVIFCLPAQRSGRYLLEAMPALAVLMALRWHHVGRNAFVLTHIGVLCALVPILWLSVLLAREIGVTAFSWWHWPLCAVAIAFAVASIAKPRWTAMCAAPAAMSVFLALSSFLGVFDSPLGQYDASVCEATRGRRVWVPENFRSVAELHRVLLPEAQVLGFAASLRAPPEAQVKGGDLVVVSRPIADPPLPDALGSRIELASRHTTEQLWEIATGRVRENLFMRESIVPVATGR